MVYAGQMAKMEMGYTRGTGDGVLRMDQMVGVEMARNAGMRTQEPGGGDIQGVAMPCRGGTRASGLGKFQVASTGGFTSIGGLAAP